MEMHKQQTSPRFERAASPKAEQLFDEICALKMSELVELTDILCQRLSLRVIGGFVNALEKLDAPTPPAAEPTLTVSVRAIGPGSRVEAIKAARGILGLGLKEARDFIEALPHSFEPSDSPEAARALAQQWADAGFLTELN